MSYREVSKSRDSDLIASPLPTITCLIGHKSVNSFICTYLPNLVVIILTEMQMSTLASILI